LGDFVPASDALLRKELLPVAENTLGLKIKFETINGNDLQANDALSLPPHVTVAIEGSDR
jgi:hypothetical protein